MKTLTEQFEELMKKYSIPDLRIETIDTHGKIFTSNWTKEIKSTFLNDLKQAVKERDAYVLEPIEPFDIVQYCVPDCTPEKHSYHQGSWIAHFKAQKQLDEAKKRAEETL